MPKTPVIPGVELDAGGGPDHLDETYLPATVDARLTQLPVEVAVQPAGDERITQVPVEVLLQPGGDERVTQVPVEVITQETGQVRATQVPVEVAIRYTLETVNVILLDWQVRDA